MLLRAPEPASICAYFVQTAHRSTTTKTFKTWQPSPRPRRLSPPVLLLLYVPSKTRVPGETKQRFADAIDAQVFETSAKLGTNVDLAMLALMREVLHHREHSGEAGAGKGTEGGR